MLKKVELDLKQRIPNDLVDFLLKAYIEINEHYYLGRYEPAELNGGKFVEACYRILENETKGTYTAVGVQVIDMIGKLRALEQIPITNAIESYRIHIPRALATIYNIRNKRGVGHLSGDVNPNFADSTFIVACTDWTLAELLRIHYACSLADAQKMVDAIVIRPAFLIHQIDDIKRVLNPKLKQREQALILLASEHPNFVHDSKLIEWIEPKNKRTFIDSVLKKLHSERLIEYSVDKNCLILPTGLKFVDKNYHSFLI